MFSSDQPPEADAAELYGPPDGYLDAKGTFHKERSSPQDKAVFEIEIGPRPWTRYGAFFLPRLTVCLSRHVWQRIHAVLGPDLDLENRFVLRAGTLLVKRPFGVKISVRRPVKLGSIGFQRVSRETFYIHRHRRREALGTQRVETLFAAVGIFRGGSPYLRRALLEVTSGGEF